MEYADDAVLPDETTESASTRLTNLNTKANQEAGMNISIAKTKAQHIRKKPAVSETTEKDITNIPAEKKFKFECVECGMTYPTKHGLSIHKARFCKRSRTAKKPSRKGTVADRIITRMKVEKHQNTYEKVKIGTEELENVYSFIYLGSEMASDGNPEVTVTHRINVAWGRYGDYRKTLMSTKLPIDMRVRLYRSLIVSTMTYGAEAWLVTEAVHKKLNGVNSKMLALITRRTIHEEAREPSYDTVEYVRNRRHDFLGHVLRMDENRALWRFLLELSPSEAPFKQGSLMSETSFQNVMEMLEAVEDRELWRNMRKNNREISGELHASLGTARSR